MSLALPSMPASPLEKFVRDYVQVTGGDWEEIEPQVYDIMVPSEKGDAAGEEREILRITYDPEALPEHPGAQLASFGTPLIDRFLADAVHRGRYGQFHVIGLNLAPHDLAKRVWRGLSLAPKLESRLDRVRPLLFPQVVFCFQAAFTGDQTEQEILTVAMDLHYGRQVRHLEKLLDPARLAEHAAVALPEVRRARLTAVLPAARAEVVGTLAAMANTRSRELRERLDRQIARMTRYYGDLRSELSGPSRGRGSEEENAAKAAARRQAIDREERLRIQELRQKNTLRVHLRLLQALLIHQPKLLLHATLSTDRLVAPLELVYDPLLEALEAFPCPDCQKPTFALALTRQNRIVCQGCAAKVGMR